MLQLTSYSYKCQRTELELLMGTTEIMTTSSDLTEKQARLQKDGVWNSLGYAAADSDRLLGQTQVFICDQNRIIFVTSL